jgi:hypothetical protein
VDEISSNLTGSRQIKNLMKIHMNLLQASLTLSVIQGRMFSLFFSRSALYLISEHVLHVTVSITIGTKNPTVRSHPISKDLLI